MLVKVCQDSGISFGSRFVDHKKAKQQFKEIDDVANRKRLADMLEEHDHDFPFAHQVRTEIGSVNKQTMRMPVRNRWQFDEQARHKEDSFSPDFQHKKRLPVDNVTYKDNKGVRRATKRLFEDDS